MQLPVGGHIRRLQHRLEALNEEIMRHGTSLNERNKVESEIRAVNLALEHYRVALEIEQSVAHQR
jgi:anaerobic glycerol-3-phosphate dehydrogenase